MCPKVIYSEISLEIKFGGQKIILKVFNTCGRLCPATGSSGETTKRKLVLSKIRSQSLSFTFYLVITHQGAKKTFFGRKSDGTHYKFPTKGIQYHLDFRQDIGGTLDIPASRDHVYCLLGVHTRSHFRSRQIRGIGVSHRSEKNYWMPLNWH